MSSEHGFDPRRRAALKAGLKTGIAVTGLAAMAAVTARTAQADDSAKVPPESVQYQLQPKDGAQCSGCVNFAPPNACNIVSGQISPNGWCVAYAPKAS